jgi:hypothetical protein
VVLAISNEIETRLLVSAEAFVVFFVAVGVVVFPNRDATVTLSRAAIAA